jgi:hypothetical protein
VSDIDTAIYTRMTGFAGLSALVSTRVYRQHAPDGPTLPFITFQRIGAARPITLEGEWGYVRALYYFDVFDDEHTSLKLVVTQVLECLNGLKGTYSGVDIKSILSDDEGDTFETELDIHRTTLSFYVTYKER